MFTSLYSPLPEYSMPVKIFVFCCLNYQSYGVICKIVRAKCDVFHKSTNINKVLYQMTISVSYKPPNKLFTARMKKAGIDLTSRFSQMPAYAK